MTANNKRVSQMPKCLLATSVASVLVMPLLFSATLDAQVTGGIEDPIFQYWIKEEVPRLTGDVDPYEGRLVVSADDIVVPGNGALDLVVRRVYQHEEFGNTNRGLMLDGFDHWEFGLGWKLAFMPRVRQTMFGGGTSPSEFCSFLQYSHALSLLLPDGGQDVLYMNPANASEAFTRSGWKFACVSGAVFVYSPSGLKYEMGIFARGNVDDGITATDFYATRVTDPNGNWITTSYQEPYPSSGLSARVPASVSTSDGRTLQFTYDAQGRVRQISGPNGAVWTYDYRTLPPSSVIAPFGGYAALAKVTLPNGQTHEYDYYEPGDRQWPSQEEELASMYRIESIKGVHGGAATYTYIWQQIGQRLYDDEHYEGYPPGAPFPLTWYSRVSRKTTSDGGEWTYTYAPSLTPGQYDVTTVTGPSSTTVHKYVGRTFSVSTPGNPGVLGVPTGCGLMDAKLSRVGLLAEKHVGTEYSEVYQYTDVPFAWPTGFIHRGRPLGVTWQQAPGACQRGVFVSALSSRTVTLNGAQYVTEHLAHDVYGNPTSIRETGPNGGSRTTTRSYYQNALLNIRNRVDDETIEGVGSVVREWDSLGRLSSKTSFGVATTYSYTAAGDVASITRPGNKVTNYSQYKRGVAQAEAQAEGITISRSVNDLGHVVSEIDGEGRTHSYQYDALGRPTLIDLPVGNDAVLSYTRTSQTVTRGPLVEVTTVDGFGRPIETNRGGIVTVFQYDPLGRLIFESNPGGTVGRRYQYDALGRVTRVTNADDSYRSFVYGAASVRVTDERLNSTTHRFRAYGNPNVRYLMQVDAPVPAASIVVVRGANDLVASVTQAGVTRSFSYDARHYLMSETHPETGTTTYERDAAGNMTARIIGSVRTEFAYDGLNRLTGTNFPDTTPDIVQTWSNTNKLKTVSSSDASRVLDYDANDNLTSESLTVGATVLAATYGYDANDQLATITYPVSQQIVNYAPNALGRPTQVSGYATAVTYWPSGQIRQIDYANGTVSSYEQNSRLWPSAFYTRRGSFYSMSSTYGYDGAGNMTSIADAVDSTMNRTLGYDGIDRLMSASGPWGSGTLGYDGAGNIASQSLGSFNLSYTYDAQNRLASVSGSRSASYGYDAYGDVTSAGGATYNYDAVPNMRCAKCGAGDRADYNYDGLRNRVKVVKSGVTTFEFHAASGDLLVEYTPSQANRLIEYIYLGGKRIAQRISDQNAPTSITPIATTVTASQAGGVTFGVNIGGTSPGGSVAFSKQGTALGTAYVVSGSASIEVMGLSGGLNTVTAKYSGDATKSGNSLTYGLTVVVPPDTTPPGAPGTPTVSNIGLTSATATWTAASDNRGVVGYDYRINTGSWQPLSNVLSINVTGLSPATNYTFAVRARDAAGLTGQPGSKTFTTLSDLVPPTVPTGLNGSAPNQTTVNLSWNAASDNVAVTGYRVYRNGSHIANGATTSYSDTGRSACTLYSYQVAAHDAAPNVSNLSAAINVITPDQTAPSTPTGLSAAAAGPSRINLSWVGSSDVGCGVASYQIYRNGVHIDTTTATSYSSTGLAASTAYSYTVVALDGAVNPSGHSNTASATTWAPVIASLSATSWTWRKRGSNPTTVSPPVTCAGSGGSGSGYTYSWQYVSGDTGASAMSPNSSSTSWARNIPYEDNRWDSVWRCVVTDSGGNTGQNTVGVAFIHRTIQ